MSAKVRCAKAIQSPLAGVDSTNESLFVNVKPSNTALKVWNRSPLVYPSEGLNREGIHLSVKNELFLAISLYNHCAGSRSIKS